MSTNFQVNQNRWESQPSTSISAPSQPKESSRITEAYVDEDELAKGDRPSPVMSAQMSRNLLQVASSPAMPSSSPAPSTSSSSDHHFVLKVMRLTRPSVVTPLVVTSDSERDVLKDSLNNELKNDPNTLTGLEVLTVGHTFILPQSFGTLFLGETFTCYVSLHNDSTETCSKVALRCHLQTGTQRIPLYPAAGAADPAGSVIETLDPGGSLDNVLNYEVKELGTHILVCEVDYCTSRSQKLFFRKFFKFQVVKPLDVKTKLYSTESDEVVLEAQIHNIGNVALFLEKVSLDPSPLFSVTDLNSMKADHVAQSDVGDLDFLEQEVVPVFGSLSCLQAQDARQYLFCLTPKPQAKTKPKFSKGNNNLGKLDIVWRTYMGDRGRLQTCHLQRASPSYDDVRFTVAQIPSLVVLNQAFSITATIINNSDRTLDLDISLLNSKQPKMAWCGCVHNRLGLVEPGGCLDVRLEVVPHDSGFQVVSGVRLFDNLLKRKYDFDGLWQVFVCEDQREVDAIGL